MAFFWFVLYSPTRHARRLKPPTSKMLTGLYWWKGQKRGMPCKRHRADLGETWGRWRNLQNKAESQHILPPVLWDLCVAGVTVAVCAGWYAKFAHQVSKDFVKLEGFWVSFQSTFPVSQGTIYIY